MDRLAVLGLLIAFAAIIGGLVAEGGSVWTLLHAPAFFIVFGGTLGAIMIQTPVRQFTHAMRMLRWVLFPPRHDYYTAIEKMTRWATVARQHGFLALEKERETESDNFTRRALTMLIDGDDADQLRDTLDMEITLERERQLNASKVFEAAGGYSPTLGIVGAVLGLIQAMAHLDSPDELGRGIAVAFVATIYGVGFANVLFLPVANKLRALIHLETIYREMLVEGIMGILHGENPHHINGRLQVYLNN